MYSPASYTHSMHFWSATENCKVTCRTECGGEQLGCMRMESQIRLMSRRQRCCELLLLLERARHEVWRRLRHSSARDSVGSRSEILFTAINSYKEMPLLLDRACTVPSGVCSALPTQIVRDGKHPQSQPQHRVSCQQTSDATSEQPSQTTSL